MKKRLHNVQGVALQEVSLVCAALFCLLCLSAQSSTEVLFVCFRLCLDPDQTVASFN